MIETRTSRSIARSRRKHRVPLSKLRTSEAVRTIVDHPSRISELVNLLDDSDRSMRGRAASTIARLSETHPGRLLRILERLREALSDDSAYVRWHTVYAIGKTGCVFPMQSASILKDLVRRLDDENRIVQIITAQALVALADKKPEIVQSLFESTKHEIPVSVAKKLRKAGARS